MTYEEALRKVGHCLKLAGSPNQHEAALAAAKAQEIMDRYNLKIDDILQGHEPIEQEEEIKRFSDEPLHEVCQVDTQWTLRLAHVITQQNACRCVWYKKASGSAILVVVGRTSDVQTVRYIFGWLNREVRRITREECKGRSRMYQIDFRYGVVDTIKQKLAQQREETFQNVQQEAVNPMALVRVQNSIAKFNQRSSAVDLWFKENVELAAKQRTFRKQASMTARQHGRKAGEQVRFTKAKGAIDSGKKFIQ